MIALGPDTPKLFWSSVLERAVGLSLLRMKRRLRVQRTEGLSGPFARGYRLLMSAMGRKLTLARLDLTDAGTLASSRGGAYLR